MKVELKQITEQLTDAMQLKDNYRVCAHIQDGNIVGWGIVLYDPETGEIDEVGPTFNNLKELIENYYTMC